VIPAVGSIADPGFARTLISGEVGVVFHLAAALSGQSEAEFDAGMRVNLDGTRALLDACRTRPVPPRVVFASTIAVYGGALPEVVPRTWRCGGLVLRRRKAIAELLVADAGAAARRGVACRCRR
jgi:nucleoside-diphosphate-sugar epimerase